MFYNESFFILLNRAILFVKLRVVGFCFKIFGVFISQKETKLFIHKGMRIRNGRRIKINGRAKFGVLSRLEVYPKSDIKRNVVTIGDNFSCGDYFHLGAAFDIKIGDNVLIGSNVLIIDHDHGDPKRDVCDENALPPNEREIKGLSIEIGNNVWIGDGAVILKGSKIGDGAIIAASSTVRGIIPQRTIFK